MTEYSTFWGDMIEKTINYGREDHSSGIKVIKHLDLLFQQSTRLIHKDFTHCSHVMIYSLTNSQFQEFPNKAYILMQMRFDGFIGFPGGIVDKNETAVQAACREVAEEVGWTEENGTVSDSDYLFTHIDNENQLVLHFYAVEVCEEKLKDIEMNLPQASDFGTEVLGHFRIPLYTMGDAFRGFPAFLKNHFVGNAKLQLLEAITTLKLLTREQIIQSLHSAPKITL